MQVKCISTFLQPREAPALSLQSSAAAAAFPGRSQALLSTRILPRASATRKYFSILSSLKQIWHGLMKIHPILFPTFIFSNFCFIILLTLEIIQSTLCHGRVYLALGCSELHPIWPGRLPGIGHLQLLWETHSNVSSPSEQIISSLLSNWIPLAV